MIRRAGEPSNGMSFAIIGEPEINLMEKREVNPP
jgi:hypothetical protein